MSSTNVHSNNQEVKYAPSVAGTIFVATEKTLEVPPQGKVYEVIPSYIAEKGDMDISVVKSRLNEKGILEDENGKTYTMKNPKAYQNVKIAREKRQSKKTAGIGRD